jgi:hypothetical protein
LFTDLLEGPAGRAPPDGTAPKAARDNLGDYIGELPLSFGLPVADR